MRNSTPITTFTFALALSAGAAHGQSLFRAPMPQQPTTPVRDQPAQNQPNGPGSPGSNDPGADRKPADGKPAPNGSAPNSAPAPAPGPMPAPMTVASANAAPTLDSIGLFVVQPAKPHSYAKHDKLDIIINEISANKQEQSLDAKKDFNLESELAQFPSLSALLTKSTLTNGIGSSKPAVEFGSNDHFKGDGTYERKDRLTARIAAIVQDVKPNGLIFVEARETIQSDDEIKTMVLSGLCDPKDITNANTVQSSQLANLVIRVEHQGNVKKTATKSYLTKFFEDLFGP